MDQHTGRRRAAVCRRADQGRCSKLSIANGQTAALAAVPPAMLAVPATLNASLIARLDRVGTSGKEIAQVGAVLGREFGQAPAEPALVITVSQRAGRPPGGPYRARAGGFSGP